MKKVKEWLVNKNAQFEVLELIEETHIFRVKRLNDGQEFSVGDLLSINYPADKKISFHSIGKFENDCIHVGILIETQSEEKLKEIIITIDICEINDLKKPIGAREVEDDLSVSYRFFGVTP